MLYRASAAVFVLVVCLSCIVVAVIVPPIVVSIGW